MDESTKVMNIPTGCLVQVSTQQGGNVAESVCFVPGVNLMILDNGTYFYEL